ncbi:hypothetical protein JCM8547_004640 [Rhodosporidiobolus lusitaniae]
MAEPKKTYSIFQPRPKPAPTAPPLFTIANPPPTASSSSTAPPPPAGPSTLEPPPHKPLERTASAATSATESRGTTPTSISLLTDSSDEEDKVVGSSGGVKRKKKKAPITEGKKAKRGKEDNVDEEEELVIVEEKKEKKAAVKTKKGKKKDDGAAGPSTPTKKKKGGVEKEEAPAILDLTGSPSRPSSSTTGFVSLSETYKKEREKRKKDDEVFARWPTAEEHAAGRKQQEEQGGMEGQVWARGLKRREVAGKGKEREENDDEFLAGFRRQIDLSSPPSPFSCEPRLMTRPLSDTPSVVPSFESHPLLDRLAAPLLAASSSSAFSRPGDADRTVEDKLWSIKYGPQNADEVLGEVSGTSAKQLRDWLKEMKVQATEVDSSSSRRRPINRGVTKPKKKKKKRPAGLDDFLASSSDEEGDTVATLPSSYYDFSDLDEEEEVAELLSTSASSSRRNRNNASPTALFPTLTNLTLLVGPHGSGKTSTVHAVAMELGYEVFEVYPGMGKRRAQDIERYVGDVGKNHIVRASPKKGRAGGLFDMFRKQEKGKGKEKEDGEGDVKMKDAKEGKDKEKGPTQSLILMDEVDVLYEKEDDFWQGVASLAKQSRRPIILTCSDLSLIPTHDLAFQQIHHPASSVPSSYLSFAAPSPSIAVPYLSLIALSEGHILPSSTLTALYASSSSPTNPPYLLQQQPGDRPIPHPYSGAPMKSGGDLRKSVMRMQVDLGWRIVEGREERKEGRVRWQEGGLRVLGREKEEEEDELTSVEEEGVKDGTEEGDALERAAKVAEAMSAADALVDRRIRTRLEDDESGQFTTASDSLYSHETVLTPIYPDENRHQLPFLGAEPLIASEIRRMARRVWGGALGFGEKEDEELEEKRADFSFNLACLTQPVALSSDYLPPALVSPSNGTPQLPHPVSTVLYRPFLRLITLADDAWEAELGVKRSIEAEGGGGGGGGVAQNVRRSMRGKGGEPAYKRRVRWNSEKGAEWLRRSGFPGKEEVGGAMDGDGQERDEEEEKVVKKRAVVEDDEK